MNINEKKVYGWLKNYEYMMCIINDNKKECEDKILELQSKSTFPGNGYKPRVDNSKVSDPTADYCCNFSAELEFQESCIRRVLKQERMLDYETNL